MRQRKADDKIEKSSKLVQSELAKMDALLERAELLLKLEKRESPKQSAEQFFAKLHA